MDKSSLIKINDYQFKIDKSYKKGMRVDGIVYADDKLMENILKDNALEQVCNVAFLPGIVKASMAMPDMHWGYGFAIGGVCATDVNSGGVISPGGVGFDINCGVRMFKTNLFYDDVKDKLDNIVKTLYNNIPSGVGSTGDIKLSFSEHKRLVINGAKWAVKNGMGTDNDLICCEENGVFLDVDPDLGISDTAYKRGKNQAGTLGSGNHFVEVSVIDKIFDDQAAELMGLALGQVAVMVHSGSRGFGYQICQEHAQNMVSCISKYVPEIKDKQLAAAPFNSKEAKSYINAMKAAANYAWCNRQILMHLTRQSFEKIFSKSWQNLGMSLIYDVAHNIAKFETHQIGSKKYKLCVHRKGATRSFGPGNLNIPDKYKKIGQPVIIPGDMQTGSYLLLGTKKAEEETFGTVCHGAGRVKSRHQALKTVNFSKLMDSLQNDGIKVLAKAKKSLIEEAPESYKNINDVIDVVENAGLTRKVCKMRPLCVIKG